MFKSSKKSSRRRLKGLPKWAYLLFPHLIQAAMRKFFQGFLNKWMYTLQYLHFLTADCCSGLHQLQSFYHKFLMLWLGLFPNEMVSRFSSFFSNASPCILQWWSIYRIHMGARHKVLHLGCCSSPRSASAIQSTNFMYCSNWKN